MRNEEDTIYFIFLLQTRELVINATAVCIRMHCLMRCCDDCEIGFRVGRGANIDAASG